MKAPRRFWTAAELAELSARYADTNTVQLAEELGRPLRGVYCMAEKLGLKKSPEYRAACSRQAVENLSVGGERTRFRHGHRTWNKGVPYLAGGRAAETQFKTGQAPHTWRPIGSNRVTKEGYLQRKIQDTGVTRKDYVGVHHLVWRLHGFEVMAGHALVFRDGDRRNFDINNLELVSHAALMLRNSVHRHGPEIAQISQLIGCINRQINKRGADLV